MQSGAGRKINYRSDIDGLRAIAVLSVIAYHVFPLRFRGGFVGVDIFFVISGFLISSILYNELQSNTFSVIEFYVRRIRRIYPALFIVLVAVCVAGWFILLPSQFVLLGKQIVGGSTFSANFVLWWQAGYFSSDARYQPLLHLWSLGVEEQFYLIFPVICMAFYRARSRRTLAAAFMTVAAVSMALNVAFVSRFSAAVFFLPFSRFWELFVGAGLALALHRDQPAPWEGRYLESRKTGIGLLGLGIILVSIFFIRPDESFPGWWGLLPTLGAALVIAAGPSAWGNRYILSSKPAVFIGLISYPLYLWHWPILSFMKIAEVFWGYTIPHLLKTAMIALAFVLAYLTYRFVEVPIRQVKQKDRRRKGALLLLGCVSITGAFGVLVLVANGLPSRLPSAIVALDHDFFPDAMRASLEGTCFLRADQLADSFSSNCVDPAEGQAAQPLLLLWGDSHASDLLAGFRAMQRQSGVRLAVYTAGGCAPIMELKVHGRPACFSINRAVLDRIRVLKPDIVVLSANWDHWDPLDNDHDAASRAAGLRQTIESLKDAGIPRVVVIGSAPFWTKSVPALLVNEFHHHPNDPIPHRLPETALEAHDDSLLKTTTENAGAVYIPLFEDLCDRTSCLVTTGPAWQDVVTYDYAHFTEHGSILVAQRIWPAILHSGE